jgi:hypothetical protein
MEPSSIVQILPAEICLNFVRLLPVPSMSMPFRRSIMSLPMRRPSVAVMHKIPTCGVTERRESDLQQLTSMRELPNWRK